MSRPVEEILEFGSLLELVRRQTTCEPGRRAVAALGFATDHERLEAAFALIREAMAWLRAGTELGFGSLADPAAWLARLQVPGAVLASQELLDAASLLDTTAWLKQAVKNEAAKYPLLAARVNALGDFRPLAAAIRRAILPNGEIADDASAELRRIRTAIGRTREKIQKALRELLRARGADPSEDYVTLRNDRFVIPVRAGERKQVPGVMHGVSATGQTLFVEPLEAVPLNNQLVQLAEDEAAEIARILRELTERLVLRLAELHAAADAIAEVDAVFARARFAREFNCTLPEFTDAAYLRLEQVRHPVLEDNLRRQRRAMVPMTLALGGSETVLVISGPNTGGKTVALKTVGLAALAAQSAIPVAAGRAVLPLVDRVLADIGDEQSITADLSTFSAHVLNLKGMLEAATERSLVLVDEMGTGTAPEEGSALAIALLEEFRQRGCLTLATTHHDRLKVYASTTPGIFNAAVEFDAVKLQPTYRLVLGVPGTSSGIAIARRLGLPKQVTARAQAELAPEAREASELIAYLHRSREELERMKQQLAEQMTQLEEERRKLQADWVERQRRRLAELERRFTETLREHETRVARLVEDIRDRDLRAQLEKRAPRQLAKLRSEAHEETDAAVAAHLAEAQTDLGTTLPPAGKPPAPEELVAGARVRLRGFPQPVVILALSEVEGRRSESTWAEVQAGPLRMRVALSEITAIVSDETARDRAGTQPARPAPPGVTVHAQPPDEPWGDEINVIGCTVEEATRRVDKFLDSAALAGKPRVRIIHGHGTGALRRGLAEFLAEHPLVERAADEEPERGGSAITVVQLRTE